MVVVTKKRKKTSIKRKTKIQVEKPTTKKVKRKCQLAILFEDEHNFFSAAIARKQSIKRRLQDSINAVIQVSTDKPLEIQKCPFCKKYTATYNMIQRRSADEGSTAVFRCTDSFCGRTWKGRS
jgi:DNA-directed RNA polymerase subunit M/transcription elongation factor TFIIS